MLKARIATAVVLLPLVVMAILVLPTVAIEIISGMFVILAAWEWVTLTNAAATAAMRIGILISYISIAMLSKLLALAWLRYIWYLAIVWWLIGIIAIVLYPRAKNMWQNNVISFVIGCLVFVSAWLAIGYIHSLANGPIWMLFACIIVWCADIAAYFTGKAWGKVKLLPAVSPAKTWAGLYGAVIGTTITTIMFYIIAKPACNIFAFVAMCFIATLFAIVGDLVESLFKRVFDCKDSGKLLPGHGGVLDRLDSLLACLPVYAIGLQILENPRIMSI